MNGIDAKLRQSLLGGGRRFLQAWLANVSSGFLAGAILARPWWFFGASLGAVYGGMAGLLLGAMAAVRVWPGLSICVACGAQFVGALTVGFGMSWIDAQSGPPDYAVFGMLGGGTVGIVLAEVVRHRYYQSGAEAYVPLCPQCGYSLRGNVSGTCPECGTPVNRSDAG